jgi:diaminohydroxyphosphoribosylaminopyrimidine deaminase/5-amino-6-(5-phosphoribosylamino)uracil reductase
VGEGFHAQAGGPHAETAALLAAGSAARGGTMYVTLEPCNHHGRTPPCTEAIINAGITEVIYAVDDPNPDVRGGGRLRLEDVGINVRSGVERDAVAELIRFFDHHVRTGRPYVIAKFAASLDGRIATRTGESKWITGDEARTRAHELRSRVDAILVGAGTAAADDPRLTARVPGRKSTDPLRIVLDSEGRVPTDVRLYSPELAGGTVVIATDRMPFARRVELTGRGVDVWTVPANDRGLVDLAPLLDRLGGRGVQSLLVEGGAGVLGSFFDAALVNEVWAFLAPTVIGGDAAPPSVGGRGAGRLKDALNLEAVSVEHLGRDILLRGKTDARPSNESTDEGA